MVADESPGQTSHEAIADNAIAVFLCIVATTALKAASSEDYRDNLSRRSELREELSAPEWMPYSLEPYYNISTWKGRLAFLVGELSCASPINWYRYPGLRRAANWSFQVDISTRWEEHDDWL